MERRSDSWSCNAMAGRGSDLLRQTSVVYSIGSNAREER